MADKDLAAQIRLIDKRASDARWDKMTGERDRQESIAYTLMDQEGLDEPTARLKAKGLLEQIKSNPDLATSAIERNRRSEALGYQPYAERVGEQRGLTGILTGEADRSAMNRQMALNTAAIGEEPGTFRQELLARRAEAERRKRVAQAGEGFDEGAERARLQFDTALNLGQFENLPTRLAAEGEAAKTSAVKSRYDRDVMAAFPAASAAAEQQAGLSSAQSRAEMAKRVMDLYPLLEMMNPQFEDPRLKALIGSKVQGWGRNITPDSSAVPRRQPGVTELGTTLPLR